jgi:hypothetical protein
MVAARLAKLISNERAIDLVGPQDARRNAALVKLY